MHRKKKISIQNIRMLIRWMTILIFGLFFLLYVNMILQKGFSYNSIDYVLSTLVILYVIGIFISFKQEIVSGYFLFFCGLAYIMVHSFFESNVFNSLDGFYLIIPGISLLILGYLHDVDYLKSVEISRLNYEITDIKQTYSLTKAMLDIVPEMIRNDDLDFILQRVLEKTIESIPKAHAGSIMLKIEDRMEFRAAVGYNLDLLSRLDLKFTDILQYKLGAIHDPVIINDVETYNVKDVYQHASFDIPEEQHIISKAMMTHVIMYQHQIFGFINIDNLEDPKAFSTKDKNVIKRVTKHIESIIENQSLIENVYKMSRYDALTGAYTRRYHQKQLEELYQKSYAKSQSFSIITFDLDDLKEKNDVHGHEAGDVYLLNFANLVRNLMPKDAFLSRIGGDEFVLVVPNSNLEMGLGIIHLIEEKSMNHLFQYEKVFIPYKFSYGISTFPNDTDDLELLIRLSDQRMYENKRKKEN